MKQKTEWDLFFHQPAKTMRWVIESKPVSYSTFFVLRENGDPAMSPREMKRIKRQLGVL